MKKTKRFKKVSLLLVCLMAVCLAGCGGNGGTTDNGTTNNGTTEATPSADTGTTTGSDNGTLDDVASGSETGTENTGTGDTADADTSSVNGAGTFATGTAQASEANPINDNIRGWTSETLRYPILESEIVDELDYENLDLSNTRYYYNYVDLNNDGKDEIVVQLNGEYSTTDDGDTLLIVEQEREYLDDDDDGFDIIAQYTGFVNPIIISDNTTNGYKDIIFMNATSNPTTYSKIEYGKDGYKKMKDAVTITSLDDITGVALLCNDIAEDTDNQTGLYFNQQTQAQG